MLEKLILTHFNDLTECNYFGEVSASSLRAVGWLTIDKPFVTGPMDKDVFVKIKELLRDHWQPMVTLGVHHCDLCQFDSPCGSANLFVPNGDLIFVCPELVVHYIAAHHYRPPDEFIEAVVNCPMTSSMQYKKLLLKSGGRTLLGKRDVL